MFIEDNSEIGQYILNSFKDENKWSNIIDDSIYNNICRFVDNNVVVIIGKSQTFSSQEKQKPVYFLNIGTPGLDRDHFIGIFKESQLSAVIVGKMKYLYNSKMEQFTKENEEKQREKDILKIKEIETLIRGEDVDKKDKVVRKPKRSWLERTRDKVSEP